MTASPTRSSARLVLAALCSLTASLVVLADSPPSTAAAPATEKKTELETQMDRISHAFRKLKKQVADPSQNAASLDLVATMQAATVQAADLTPARAADIPEDKRAAFLADYKAGLKAAQDLFTKLADALKAGDNAQAASIMSQIDAEEKKDHKQFRKPRPS